MANDTYQPENDANLKQNLTQDDIYTPENSLSLSDNLVSVPQLNASTAQAIATGETLNLPGGTATISTAAGSASSAGATIFLEPELVISAASAAGTGGTLTVSGSSALETASADASASGASAFLEPDFITSAASATGTGSTLSLSGGSTLSTIKALATGSGETRNLNTSLIPPSTASATATGSMLGISGGSTLNVSTAAAAGSGETTSLDVATTETLEVPSGASGTGTGSTLTVSGSSSFETATAEALATGDVPFLTPNIRVQTAAGSAAGQTSFLGGSTTLDTSTSAGTGFGTTIFLEPDFSTLRAKASSNGGTTSVSGTSTLKLATATGTGSGKTGLTVAPTLTPGTALAAASGSSVFLEPDLSTDSAQAQAKGGETQFADILGTGGEITVLIDGKRIDSYTNIEIQKRLNEVDTFSFEAFITEDEDRALISEGNTVKFLENYDTLLFKGRLTEVEYQSSFRAKCEGDGMVTKLLNRKTNRDTYTNAAGDDIVKSEVPDTFIDYGAIETAPQVSVRFDHDNLARAVAGVANATGYDWFIDQDPADDWSTDRLNFVEDAGRSTTQADLTIGENAQFIERNKDEGFVANDITLLGRGDGINQLEANVFAASTSYTDTTQIIDENENGSFTVEDTSQLGSTGDDLLIRVGIETMDVTISDSTTLSINSRAVDDYNGDPTKQIRHYENVRVWRLENKTQGVGRFTPETQDTAEDGSSIETKGVKEQRETDKTIVDLSTLEKVADLELKNRFEDVFRVKVQPTEPRITGDLQLGDQVKVQDLTAMNVDNTFDVVGIDIMRSSADEGTELHLANRPRRLTERLSEIESDRDTLNAHMQGATNFNGEHFEDNVDNTHPLNNKIFVPEDVVQINKFELTFARESFRGYTESTEEESSHTHEIQNVPDHTHDIDSIPDHSHDVDVDIPDHDHSFDWKHSHNVNLEDTYMQITGADANELQRGVDTTGSSNDTLEITGSPATIETGGIVTGSAGSAHTHEWPADTNAGEGDIEINYDDYASKLHWPSQGAMNNNIAFFINIYDDEFQNLTTSNSGGENDDTTAESVDVTANTSTDVQNTPSTTETTNTQNSPTSVPTTESGSAHSHEVSYGIFEPTTEPEIDVEVYVDGNLVTTVNNVSVGEEITNPISLKNDLADPLTGTYHDIELKPVGGNNGRSRLTADVTEKVFIESTL